MEKVFQDSLKNFAENNGFRRAIKDKQVEPRPADKDINDMNEADQHLSGEWNNLQLEGDVQKRKNRAQFFLEQIIQHSAIIQDLGNKFQKACQNQNEVKATALAFMHDLRNPMTVISSCTQSCLENKDLPTAIKKNLRMIQTSSKQAIHLIKNFLESKQSHFDEYRPVNINQLLTRTWEIAKLQNPPCQVTFKAELGKDLPEIMAVLENLERVFLNLFMNAIQAAPEKGKVRVQTRYLPAESMVEVRISDNGPGIPKECQDRIFEPFFTTKTNGTGLGLYICYSLVEHHRGKIAVSSKKKKGTTVSVKLPLKPGYPGALNN